MVLICWWRAAFSPHLCGCFFLPEVLVIVLALLWFWISISLWNANIYSHRLKETEPLRFPSAVSFPAGFCLRQVFQSLSSSVERSVYHTSSMKPTAPTETPVIPGSRPKNKCPTKGLKEWASKWPVVRLRKNTRPAAHSGIFF